MCIFHAACTAGVISALCCVQTGTAMRGGGKNTVNNYFSRCNCNGVDMKPSPGVGKNPSKLHLQRKKY